MKLLIDIPDNTYYLVMAKDWKNAGWLFNDESRAIHDGIPFVEVLQEIREEIESKMESIIGKYDSSTPTRNMPSAKIERNEGRKECLEIIDKYLEQYKEEK